MAPFIPDHNTRANEFHELGDLLYYEHTFPVLVSYNSKEEYESLVLSTDEDLVELKEDMARTLDLPRCSRLHVV